MRKPKMIIGISLIVQAITMFVLFLSFMNKNKKQLAGTFLTVGVIGGAVGLWMLYLEYLETENQRHIDAMDACHDCDSDSCCDCSLYDGFEEFDDDEISCSIQEEAPVTADIPEENTEDAE